MAIELHWSTTADSGALAALHRDAWRYAYAGIIPGVALERMVARRGPGWWGAMHRAGGRALMLSLDGTAAGFGFRDRRERIGDLRWRRVDPGGVHPHPSALRTGDAAGGLHQ